MNISGEYDTPPAEILNLLLGPVGGYEMKEQAYDDYVLNW